MLFGVVTVNGQICRGKGSDGKLRSGGCISGKKKSLRMPKGLVLTLGPTVELWG